MCDGDVVGELGGAEDLALAEGGGAAEEPFGGVGAGRMVLRRCRGQEKGGIEDGLTGSRSQFRRSVQSSLGRWRRRS